MKFLKYIVLCLLAATAFLPSVNALPGQKEPLAIEWDANLDEIVGYKVYLVNEGQKTVDFPQGVLTLVTTIANKSTVYEFPVGYPMPAGKAAIAVTAYNESGESGLSNIVYANPMPGRPINVRIVPKTQ